MKTFKTILAAALVTAAFTGIGQAQTVIHIVGSNADRPITNTAISHLLTGGSIASSNATLTSANFVTWTGGTINISGSAVAVTIKTSFGGASAGIQAVAGSLPLNFLPDGAAGTSNADPTVSGNPHESAVPDITMSSEFPGTTPYAGVYLGHTYEDLSANDNILAVLGFKFVASPGFPSGLTLTSQQAQLLWTVGYAPLATYTGNSTDQTKSVYATGRNLDAGARFVTFAETGIGINTYVKQYKPTITGAVSGTGGTVTSQVLYPVDVSTNGISSQFAGNSGASTGSTLAGQLTAVMGSGAYKVTGTNATAGYYIGYLAETDADNTAIPNGAIELKWNGVAYSQAAIQQGQYTFWSYEHLLHRAALSGVPLSLANSLINQITNTDASVAGIFLNTMVVSRLGEGQLVTANYF